MGLISRVPGGYYDVTDHAGLNTASKYNGTDAVDSALASAIQYGIDNDLTLLFPINTRFKIFDTVKAEDVTTGGHHTSPGSIGLVGQQGGTPAEIFLGDGATANGFTRSGTLGANSNTKAMIHLYKSDTPGGAYPPASEDAETFYAGTLQGLRLNGNGFVNCSVVMFSAAQDCVLSDLIIDADGCYAGLCGWPGRGVSTRNIEIIGGRYGVYQKNPYISDTLSESYTVGEGGQFINFYLHGQTHFGIWQQCTRGSLSMTGIRITMDSGIGIYCRPQGSNERGATLLVDSIIKMNNSGIGIQANNSRVGIFNSYFKNCGTVMDSVETTEPDYAGSATGWFYVKRYFNSPTTGAIKNVLRVNGVATTDDIVDSANGPVSKAPDNRIATQHYFREADFLDPTKVIWATDHTGTAAPWTSTTAAVTPVLSDDQATDHKAGLDAKIAEAAAAGKTLMLTRGAAIGQGYYNVSGPLVLPATLPGLLGQVCKRTVIRPTQAWRTTETVNKWIIDTEDSATADGYIAYLVLPCVFYNASRVSMLRWRWAKGVVLQCWGSNQASGRFDYPNYSMYVTGNGGGRIISVRNGGSLTDSPTAKAAIDLTDRRWVMIKDTTQPITFFGLDPEFGGAPERSPVHPAMVKFQNAINFRCLGSKSEAWQNSFEFAQGSVGFLGPVGCLIAGDPGSYGSQPLGTVKVDASVSVELFSVSKKFGGGVPYVNTGSKLIDETVDVSPQTSGVFCDSNMAYYRRGDIGDQPDWATVWKTFTDADPAPAENVQVESTQWFVYFAGATPSTSDILVSEVELAQTFNGADVSGTATVSVSSGGSNSGNAVDNNQATDMSATADVTVKFAFASPVVLTELRWLPSDTATNIPVAVVVECYDATLGSLRRMAIRKWPDTFVGTRVVRFNARASNIGMAQRARTKNLGLVT